MAKRNTVRINMDLLDGYLKAKNIHPKDFCEKQLGFSDGWYYGIRKNGGRGVKVLVAQLIARSIGVDYETLVIEDAEGTREERGTGNPSPTAEDRAHMEKTREELKRKEETESNMICVSCEDMLDAILDFALITDCTHEEVTGFIYAVNSMMEKSNARKEIKKNARPEEN